MYAFCISVWVNECHFFRFFHAYINMYGISYAINGEYYNRNIQTFNSLFLSLRVYAYVCMGEWFASGTTDSSAHTHIRIQLCVMILSLFVACLRLTSWPVLTAIFNDIRTHTSTQINEENSHREWMIWPRSHRHIRRRKKSSFWTYIRMRVRVAVAVAIVA